MSLASLLSIARSALLAQQRAMSVTAHNVANANTQGYSRQRLDLVAAAPEITPTGLVGRGVTEAGIRRVRDDFFDARYRSESGLLGDSTAMGNFLGQVESAIQEPSDNGLAASLDGLFSSFSDLANNPTNSTSRALVQQAGRRFVQQLHQLDATVHQVADDALTKMRDQVTQANDLARRIGELNQQILSTGGPGGSAARPAGPARPARGPALGPHRRARAPARRRHHRRRHGRHRPGGRSERPDPGRAGDWRGAASA